MIEEALRVFELLKVATDRHEEAPGLRAVIRAEAPRALAVAGAVMAVPQLVLPQLIHVLVVRVAEAEGAEGPLARVSWRRLPVQLLV